MIQKIIERIMHDEDAMIEKDIGDDLCTRRLSECIDCMECWPLKLHRIYRNGWQCKDV
jgi:hypothetical protein